MISLEPESEALAEWQFHNLLFHRQTRLQRLDDVRKSKIPQFEDRERSHRPIATIFNAVLENTETPLLEQYRQLKDSKQQQTILKAQIPADINYNAEIEALEAEIKALEDSIPKLVRDRLSGSGEDCFAQ